MGSVPGSVRSGPFFVRGLGFPDWVIEEADRRAAALSTAGRRFSQAQVIRTWVAEALEQEKYEK